MQFVRKSLIVVLVPIFTVLLYTTAIDVGFVRIGTHPATIKTILAKSGIYQSVVPELLDQGKQISASGGTVSLTDSKVRLAAVQAFTPQLVQNDSEAAIDGVYDWLDGKAPLPDFQIDLTAQKQAFAANVAKLVETQLQGLPVCTAEQAASFDPLNASCLPPGVTAASAAQTAQSNVLSGKGFLDNPVITASTIKNNNTGQPVFTSKNVKQIPSKYQRAKKTPYILGLLTVVIGLAIIFLSLSRAAGLRRVGWPLLIVGLILLVFAWGLNQATTKTIAPKISVNNRVLQNSLRILVVDVEQAVDKSYWWFGAGYAVLGAGAVAGSMYLKRQAAPQRISTAAPTPPAGAEPPKPTEPPKPKRPIKIQ